MPAKLVVGLVIRRFKMPDRGMSRLRKPSATPGSLLISTRPFATSLLTSVPARYTLSAETNAYWHFSSARKALACRSTPQLVNRRATAAVTNIILITQHAQHWGQTFPAFCVSLKNRAFHKVVLVVGRTDTGKQGMLFNEIGGQETVKKQLINTVHENRVSHAQLFLGPEGSGSLALAIAYAQYLNCEDRHPTDSCGSCASCRKYEKLIHPDLHFSYPYYPTTDSPLSTDVLQEWRSTLLQNPYFGFDSWREKLD